MRRISFRKSLVVAVATVVAVPAILAFNSGTTASAATATMPESQHSVIHSSHCQHLYGNKDFSFTTTSFRNCLVLTDGDNGATVVNGRTQTVQTGNVVGTTFTATTPGTSVGPTTVTNSPASGLPAGTPVLVKVATNEFRAYGTGTAILTAPVLNSNGQATGKAYKTEVQVLGVIWKLSGASGNIKVQPGDVIDVSTLTGTVTSSNTSVLKQTTSYDTTKWYEAIAAGGTATLTAGQTKVTVTMWKSTNLRN